MSTSNIIIRLQNLPNEARAIDIRRFFAGLNIPDGGVHVVGGEKGDAFINFSSDDDARQAMMKSGQIYGNPIRLYLSSRAEMQEVISRARASSMTKSLSTNNETLTDPSMSNPNESNGNAPATSMTKLSLPHPLNSLLNDYQSNKFPPAAPMVDPNNPLFLAAAQNATTPLAIQQLLAALNDKSSNSFPNYPFPLNMMNNPLQNFLPPASATTNGTLPPQYLTALQQQQQQTAALLFPNAPTPSTFLSMPTATTHAEEFYVRIRNIPVAYSYYNIKGLFGKYKLHLSDIKIINDQNGQRTGEIVLRLHSHQDLLELLAQDGRIPCFNAMLDIKKIDEYTFASSIDSFVPAHAKKTPGMTVKNCIRVTGLPKKYERKDVKRFFAGCNVTNRPGGIFIEADKINGPTFVEFETEIDAEKAFFYNGEQIGSSVIEMYRMTKADMENEINSLKRTPASDRTGRRPPLLSHEPSSTSINADSSMICLRMKNIPYTSTEQQIYEYFANNSTPIESCKLLRDRFNRGAGEALIRFHDPQSCQRAYETTNRKTFHGRSLDLRPLSNYEYQTASITPTLTSNDRQSPSSINAHFPSGGMKRPGTFFERADDDRRSDKRARWDPNQKDGNFSFNRSLMMKDDHDDSKISSTSSNSLPPLPAELKEYAGRILFLSNVAYRATRDEILDFLRDYSPIEETLKIRCDGNGKPMGYAVIACQTEADASRALKDLNNQTFINRKLVLQLR